ncbi:MAG: hypothetical protein HYV07_19755 [Deltaproteobacteria bacterium]|nr:hypothetical protein [Deltaproteobacteria bacterium]
MNILGTYGPKTRTVWAVSMVASCSSPPRLELPASVDYVAVFELDREGFVTASSGIERYRPGLAVVSSSDEVRIVGWTSDQLVAAGMGSEESLLQPLATATGCEQTLPPPISSHSWTEEGLFDATPPRLTTPWIQGVCPELEPARLSFRFDCFESACQPSLTRRGRCDFGARFDCPELSQQLDARVDRAGHLCLDLAAASWACREGDLEAGLMSTHCESPSCRVEVELRPEAPPFSVSEAGIHDTARPPFSSPDSMLLPPGARDMGYAHDFAVLEDRVVVSATDGSAVESCDLRSGHLELFDLETLERSLAPAPDCLTRLLRDPTGAGFLGLYARGSTLALARFDAEGRLVDRSERLVVLDGSAPACLAAAALESVGQTVMVGLRPRAECPNERSAVVRYAVEALDLVGVTRSESGEVLRAAVPVSERTVVLAFDGLSASRIAWLDVDSEAASWVTIEPRGFRDSNSVSDVALIDGTDRVLVSISRQRPGVLVVAPSGVIGEQLAFHEESGDPVSGRSWQGKGILMLGTRRQSQAEWPSFVTLYDPAQRRFLAGSWPLGRGPGRLRADSKGRMWILYPWESKVRRLTGR